MSEVKVTPLARRLAEENGIDWRRLNGTGPENTVVERDILGFLAKVMAGEVSLPPAVEEAAPTPDHIPNMAQAQALLQKEGVQLNDLMPAGPAMISEPPVGANRSTLDDLDLDFDFDLEAEPEMAPPVAPAPSKSPTLLELAPEPQLADAPAAPVVEAHLPSFEGMPSKATDRQGFRPELEGLPALPELEASPPAAPESPKLVWETQEVLPKHPAPEPEPLHSGMTFSSEPVESEPAYPQPAESYQPQSEAAPDVPHLAEELPPLPPLSAEPLPDLPSQAASAPVYEDHAPEGETEVSVHEEILPAPAVSAPVSEAPQFTASPAEAEHPAPQAVLSAPKAMRLQAWQRMVELRPALEATQTLSEAWRTEVPLYALLYRAVDKALSDTQLPMRATKGSLDGEELKSHRVMPTQTLRGTLDSLNDASEPGEGLAVLSLVDSPFDQVVFPGATLLTLGRASGEHALLTLSAEVSHQEAGALLERIGYYLERPILLA
mgnify:CR=1 FL=1